MTSDQLCALLSSYRFYYSDETVLQDSIERVLLGNGIPFKRERYESDGERPDFMVGGIALEVKIKGGTAALTRQVYRYAKLPTVSEIVVVASRSRLAGGLPEEINGKPIRVVSLASSAFV